ncbi:MAG: hypothetical protein ACSLFP_14725 [Acidimicrobiales bacterium]
MTADEHDHDPVHQGLEHLQTAAREVIQASRSLLDAAEHLVDDPKAVQDLVSTFTAVAAAAAGRLRSDAPRRGDDDDDGDDDGRVHSIRIS